MFHLTFQPGLRLSQEWRNLTFIHWKVDEELLRKHIPKELEIDKYNGGCYVGLVPFVMKMCGLRAYSLFRESQLLENSMSEHT